MKTYQIYIGANNATGKLETGKIYKILSFEFDGFTVQKSTGFWKGTQERSAVITVATKRPIMPVIQKLKLALKQEAIAYMQTPQLLFA